LPFKSDLTPQKPRAKRPKIELGSGTDSGSGDSDSENGRILKLATSLLNPSRIGKAVGPSRGNKELMLPILKLGTPSPNKETKSTLVPGLNSPRMVSPTETVKRLSVSMSLGKSRISVNSVSPSA
jgi:hypothetical protein